MFFNFLLGRGMVAAEDEETVSGDSPRDAATGVRDDVDEQAGNSSTDTAVRLEDVLLQLTEAEREEDAAVYASFSGISEEDRLVLMQFLPQLELMKEDKSAKDIAERDSSSNFNPIPSPSNGFFTEQESYLEPDESPLGAKESPTEPQESPLIPEPMPHIADSLAEQEDSPETNPQPPSPNSNPQLPPNEAKQEYKEHKSEESPKLDEIMKELKSIKRQQTITHCLMSVLIVITAVWQFSEVSIILSVKDKVSHPFRAIGGFFSRALLGGEKMNVLENMPSPEMPPLEMSQLPHIKLPQLSCPHVDLPSAVIESIEDFANRN